MNKEKIIENIDLAINDLVYHKTSLIKAYNYYNCKRNAELFRHLEENFGIGTPTLIEFIPLVRKHIDALVGEYSSIPTMPKISCKDLDTLSNIMRLKQLLINSEVFSYYKKLLNNDIMKVFDVGGQQQQLQLQAAADPLMEKSLKNLLLELENSFTSDYEVAALNILTNVMQSRQIDFETKKAMLAKDLYVSGTAYYKVYKTENGDLFNFEVLNPLHTFIDRNPNSVYLKDSYRSVIRRYMNKNEILVKYGDVMDDKAIAEVKKIEYSQDRQGLTYYVRSNELFSRESSTGIMGGFEVNPALPKDDDKYYRPDRLIEVMEVEWLDSEKENGKFIMYRYEGVRINGNIYIPIGKVKVLRSITEPSKACLSVNGIFFSDRNGEPFSLVLATASLLDKFDLLHWYRDNLIASSGTKGDWLDISMLPTFLGADITERIMKFAAYKKQLGIGIIDTSLEGRAFNNNTTFAGYDDSLRGDVMQAFDYAILSIELTCCSITGVSRERLGGVEQYDAVSNVEVGVKMSAIITRQYFLVLDTLIKEVLSDCLNMAKEVYKNGITGTIILGDKLLKVFTALPENYTMTDFDIHVNDSSEMNKDVETIKQFTKEMIGAGLMDAETAVDSLDAKSISECKRNISKGIKKQEEKQGMVMLLQLQLQQAQQLLLEMLKQLQEAQQMAQQADLQKLQAEAQIEKNKLEVEWFKAKSDKHYKDEDLKLKREQILAEVLQLYDNNPNNDEIKDIV